NDAAINQMLHRAVFRRDRNVPAFPRISMTEDQLIFCFSHLCTHDCVPSVSFAVFPLPLGEGKGEGVVQRASLYPHPNPLPKGEGGNNLNDLLLSVLVEPK